MPPPIRKILIANRGEPVRRGLKTFRRMGLAAGTTATAEDLSSDWVAESDFCTQVSSYLCGEEIIARAKRCGADAIWPGWGFLSEDPAFAEGVVQAGLAWIGPPAEVILKMGSKCAATELAREAGLVTIPEMILHDPDELPQDEVIAGIMGFPLLLKPALGGGGQGQEVVSEASKLKEAWKRVVLINNKLFKSGPILIQRYLSHARHIETQILADRHGGIVVLGERECSVQRRNQKVIEEAPSPALTDALRAELLERSAGLARHIGYQSAGTIEFLLEGGQFYFLEMNTRLQVEHPVTEETMRLQKEDGGMRPIDLLEEMVRVAAGERLSFNQSQLIRVGHAVEARVYAEDVSQNYRPAPGRIRALHFPRSEALRLESSLAQAPAELSPSYDPMIAKMVTWGPTREEALRRLAGAIEGTVILGVPTNLHLCHQVVSHPRFIRGQYDTRFLKEESFKDGVDDVGALMALAAVVRYDRDLRRVRASLKSQHNTSFHHVLRQVPENGANYEGSHRSWRFQVNVREEGFRKFKVTLGKWSMSLELIERRPYRYTVLLPGGAMQSAWAAIEGDTVRLCLGIIQETVELSRKGRHITQDPHTAPMAGQVVKVFVEVGQAVTAGQELFQMESMKMISSVAARHDALILEVVSSAGDPVKAGGMVVRLSPRESSKDAGEAPKVPPLGMPRAAYELTPAEVILHYAQGYDIPEDLVEASLKQWEAVGDGEGPVVDCLIQGLEYHLQTRKLMMRYQHLMAYIAEQGGAGLASIPHEAREILQRVIRHYGLGHLAEISRHPRIFIHLLQAMKRDGKAQNALWVRLCGLAAKAPATPSPKLAGLITKWLETKPVLTDEQRNNLGDLLGLLHPDQYHALGPLPVAMEYWQNYQSVKRDPAFDLDPLEYQQLLAGISREDAAYDLLLFDDYPAHLKGHLLKWFQYFQGREIPLPGVFREGGIHLYELIVSAGHDLGKDIPPRYIVLALVGGAALWRTKEGGITIPQFEKSAMLAYRALRLVQGDATHRPNNVFLLSADGQSIPWRTRDGDGGKDVLTPLSVRHAANRIGGFASGLQIQSTEAVLPLLNDWDNRVYWTIIEMRHSQAQGIVSRPPILIGEREPKKPQDLEEQMTDRQSRMGKLLNRDRAMLLFDNGEYEEMLFPEADDKPGIGLNVYKGRVNGVTAMAYAGDFRVRGGALGEREGKKIASCVVLAYLSRCPLVAFHDGAGANIKDSVASLGWAGAYFGAIAHTGGFSDREKFRYWITRHINRGYFEKVLAHFGFSPVDDLIDTVKGPLIHFHLHVGATVGMLVYGASIAHLSLMNDQPESYRVLTGAGTVRSMLGERGTNYSLGGARVHAEKSGDVEMIFESEEQVIDAARRLIKLFTSRPGGEGPPPAGIRRHSRLAVLDTPKRAGIVMGRAAILSHVDGGEFFEIRPRLEEAGGLLTGYASMAGRPVAIIATATDYGLSHANAFKKATLLLEAAQDISLPVILVNGAQWEAPSRPVAREWLSARQEFLEALRRVHVPKVSLALGPRAMENGIHQHMDLSLYVMRHTETAYEKKRAHEHMPLTHENLSEAFDRLAALLTYLPDVPGGLTPQACADPADRRLDFSLPHALNEAYDMREVVSQVFDRDSFLELWAPDALPLITGWARLGGRAVGVIADNPQIESGAQNVDAIVKFTRFNRLCERFQIPLIEFNDSPAFRPGHEQEHSGIQGVGGRSIREECLSRIPKIAVTLRQNYGGRFIHANLITLGPPRIGLAIQGAKIGVMGAKGAVGVLYGKKIVSLSEEKKAGTLARWQQEYEKNQLNPEQAISLGYIEKLIPMSDLRRELWGLCNGAAGSNPKIFL